MLSISVFLQLYFLSADRVSVTISEGNNNRFNKSAVINELIKGRTTGKRAILTDYRELDSTEV